MIERSIHARISHTKKKGSDDAVRLRIVTPDRGSFLMLNWRVNPYGYTKVEAGNYF